MWSIVLLSIGPSGFPRELFLGPRSLAAVLYCGIGSNKLVPGGLIPSAILIKVKVDYGSHSRCIHSFAAGPHILRRLVGGL